MGFVALGNDLVPMIKENVPSFMALPLFNEKKQQKADAAILGIPFDGTPTYRAGKTALATSEIRKFSLLYSGNDIELGYNIFDYLNVFDSGDAEIFPGDAKKTYDGVTTYVKKLLSDNIVPIIIGGDHGVNIPVTKAISESDPRPFGVIVFDTHLDLRDERELDRLTRSSPCRRLIELPNFDPKNLVIIGARGFRQTAEQIALVKEIGINVFTIRDIDRLGIEDVTEQALKIATINGRPPYISVDIDSLDCAFAPATNSPDPCGLTSRELFKGVRIAARNGFLGFDLVEVVPEFDSEAGITSIIAARIIAEALGCLAEKNKNK